MRPDTNTIHTKLFSLNRFCFALSFFSAAVIAHGQGDTTARHPTLIAEAFLESYFTKDFNEPADGSRPFFLYNYPAANSLGVNLAFVKLSYTGTVLRSNISLMGGHFVQTNTSDEPDLVKHILDLNVGIRLIKKLWLDVGIFPSHIGFESLKASENWNLTRSMAAESTPYYESGARLQYTFSDKWKLSLFYLNGWQRSWPSKAQPSFGSQLVYTPGKKWLFNYSTFSGYPYNNTMESYRVYNDVYATWSVTEKTQLMAGVGVGLQKHTGSWQPWYAPQIQFRQRLIKNLHLALRGEYFYDQAPSVLILPPVFPISASPDMLNVTGFSANIDYRIFRMLGVRAEYRIFQSNEKIFDKKTDLVDQNQSFTASLIFEM